MKQWTIIEDDSNGYDIVHHAVTFDLAYRKTLSLIRVGTVFRVDSDGRTIHVEHHGIHEGENGMAKVRLLAHTQLSDEYRDYLLGNGVVGNFTDGEAVALTAIRTCYSHLDPWNIVPVEGDKYFANVATDDGSREVDRLFRQITGSGHTSTMEHVSFTFAIKGVSRSLLAQLTRHRVGMSFSVQSQRYVRFGSDDRSGGFDHVVPPSVVGGGDMATESYHSMMHEIQTWYDMLRKMGVPAEDARMVLPNAAAVNLVMSANLTSLIAFYSKRRKGNGAQWEIADFAEQIRQEVAKVEPWTDRYFENAWHGKHV